MDRAAKAVRRSGARLLGAAHGDLSVLISEMKTVKSAAKAFKIAQTSVSQYMLKWAAGGENAAIQDVITHIDALSQLWSEVQQEFIDALKELRYTFGMILEGEKSVALVKQNLNTCEQKENKYRKELQKAQKSSTNSALPNLVNQLEYRVSQSEQASNHAHMSAVTTTKENEAVKMIRIKEGLLKMSQAYVELGQKCAIIFQAQSDVIREIPDVGDREIEDLKYSGFVTNRQRVHHARLRVHQHTRRDKPRLSVKTTPKTAGDSSAAKEDTLPPTNKQKAVSLWLADLPPPYTAISHEDNSQHSGRRSCPPPVAPSDEASLHGNPRRQSMPAYEHRSPYPRLEDVDSETETSEKRYDT